jgi:DNA invertase Pin-like site-specific DNA recombinase
MHVGYARCSTDEQDLNAQRGQLEDLGIAPERIYCDSGLSGRTRARPGLDAALAAVRPGDTLAVTKLDRLARSVPDAIEILSGLSNGGVMFRMGGSVYDWADPMARMFLQILAVIAEFEVALIRQRTREGMVTARAAGKLKGRAPKLKPAQRREVLRMRDSGDYSIADIAGMFGVSRPTIYRVLEQAAAV